ncbi:MAG: hypothetical protein WCP97_00570 [bacterium]
MVKSERKYEKTTDLYIYFGEYYEPTQTLARTIDNDHKESPDDLEGIFQAAYGKEVDARNIRFTLIPAYLLENKRLDIEDRKVYIFSGENGYTYYGFLHKIEEFGDFGKDLKYIGHFAASTVVSVLRIDGDA